MILPSKQNISFDSIQNFDWNKFLAHVSCVSIEANRVDPEQTAPIGAV